MGKGGRLSPGERTALEAIFGKLPRAWEMEE